MEDDKRVTVGDDVEENTILTEEDKVNAIKYIESYLEQEKQKRKEAWRKVPFGHYARPRGTESARIVTLIETVAMDGYGISDDPLKFKHQYWSLEGVLVAEGVNEEESVCYTE